MMNAVALTITFLTKASYASLNGSDKEADNIVSIKKIQARDGQEYPYCSSQAVRRALREQLAAMGWPLSETSEAKQKKGAASTQCDPQNFIDDDLFGFMQADKDTIKRTSPIRVSALVSLDPYRGDMDFGTNYMSMKTGGSPNIFETETHCGYYVGTVLAELDRVGSKSQGDKYALDLSPKEKIERLSALCDAVQNLWTVGRQSRFLSDMSPKLACAALLKVKNPIFLESVRVMKDGNVDRELIYNTLEDFKGQVLHYAIGERKGFFPTNNEDFLSLGQCFSTVKQWLNEVYGG
ncbi:MAG: type I-B CRISPR-associated protein Cas7/Cst2/DevR [Clostridiales bacterium]|jgi:CRISPR-associated protein Cst2|nr:type I-B CRISPR-associated protein Cas7/Cst2/DevR [Eubacteriales bacterium]MDH7567311.1 type I-B CRISPR-associated protein Cas7/Cst2/DevR [Clostridiales bacterium]